MTRQDADFVLADLTIEQDSDVVLVRQRAHQLAKLLGFDKQDQTRIATAISEIARNALIHGRGGRTIFALETAGSEQRFVTRVDDEGPGIADLDAVLEGRHRTSVGTPFGISAARRLMDSVDISTRPAEGTHVTLVRRLPRGKRFTAQDLPSVAAKLATTATTDPLVQLREQNREVTESFDEVRSRQAEVERLNAELEDTNRGVVALYSELDDKAEQLNRASELKSRFLSNMGHEFRTPLNSILALTGLLLDEADGKLSSEQQRQVTFIRTAAANLTELVNDLLDLAKVESGNVDVRPRKFTVNELFGGLRGMLKPLLINDQVNLVFEEARDLPELETDMGKLSQILRNFISNALKFTEHGEVRAMARLAQDRTRIEFAVRDTGIGIAPENHEAVFDEFIQVENPLQTRYKGTGLGLPLSKRLAELLGGKVTLESVLGQGSTFTASIPPYFNHQDSVIEPTPPKPDITPKFASRHLVIIDDEEAFRYVLRQLMSGFSFQISEAADGTAGLDLIRREKPDAVFLDLQMPKLDGYGVLEAMAHDRELCRIPVVICTSSVLGQSEHDKLAAAEVVLPKHTLARDTVTGILEQLHLISVTGSRS